MDYIDEKGFYQARTFRDVINLYLDFLNGKSRAVPTYLPFEDAENSGLYEDTVGQLQEIKQLNQLGFLTLDSQDGRISPVSKGYSIHQRAYIKGLIPTFLGEVITKMFIESSDIICLTSPLQFTVKESISDPRLWVTIEHSYEGGKETTKPFTSFPFVQTTNDFDIIEEYLNPKTADLLYKQLSVISFMDFKWGRSKFLVSTILKALQQVTRDQQNNWQNTCILKQRLGRNDIKQLQQIAKNQFKIQNVDNYDSPQDLCKQLTNTYSLQQQQQLKDYYIDSGWKPNVYDYMTAFYKESFPTVSLKKDEEDESDEEGDDSDDSSYESENDEEDESE